MRIILSQRIDVASEYEDVPFSVYHFPKRYINQIHPGDRFIYYQGSRYKKDHRYYFGCGVIGNVEPDPTGEYFYAEIFEGHPFKHKVPIYHPDGGFYESIDFADVRNKPNPSWQNSIRKISDRAFNAILQSADMNIDVGNQSSQLESNNNPIDTLKELNKRYRTLSAQERSKRIQKHLDRGSSVTKALKSVLGTSCQICGWSGFAKKDGSNYIEAHHLVQMSEKSKGSLCTENIILACPNCHREIHYGKNADVYGDGNLICIDLSNHKTKIMKNTIAHLESVQNISS